MAETRIDKDIPIFGENALAGEIKEFGTTTDSTDINELLSTTEAGRGWFFLGTTDFPTKEQFNAIGFSLTKFIKYLYERGIAEWNTNVNYPVGGWVIASNGRPYRALTANSGNDPIGDTTNWEQPVLFQERDKNITHDITVDADYTLTDDQNLYGRINITDTGAILTTARNIIVDNVEKNSFIFQNSTAQDLTVKTSAGTGILVSSGETKVLRNDGTNVLDSDFTSVSDGLTTSNLLHAQDQKPNGTGGGSSTSGTSVRTINTIVTNNIVGSSLSSNQIVLPAGDYWVEFSVPSYRSNQSRGYFYNATDGQNEIVGKNSYSVSSVGNGQVESVGEGLISIASSKTFELKQYITTSRATDGLGYAVSSGDVEIFTEVKLWKVG